MLSSEFTSSYLLPSKDDYLLGAVVLIVLIVPEISHNSILYTIIIVYANLVTAYKLIAILST